MASKCSKRAPGEPTGYVDWDLWAEKKSRRHYQVKCPKCGLFHIWKRKVNND